MKGKKDYGPLIDQNTARSDAAGGEDFPGRGPDTGIQMSDTASGVAQRKSQR